MKKVVFCECGCGKLLKCSESRPKRRYWWGHKFVSLFQQSQLCECGCNGLTKPNNRFINGHNRRNIPSWNKGKAKPKSPPQLCACGCGKMTNPGKKFIRGHNGFGKVGWSKGLTKYSNEKILATANKKRKYPESILNHHLCECGCEELVASNLRFIYGHNRRNYPMSEETKNKISISNKGKPNGRKGTTNSKEHIERAVNTRRENNSYYINGEARKRISQSVTELWKDSEYRNKITISQEEANQRPEVKKNKSKARKKSWQDPEFIKKQMKSRHVKQNKAEKKLEDVLQDLFPNEYKFVGDGEIIIAGKCPDFININGKKKIIELYGDYWHQGQDHQDRIDQFKPYGYQTLVIWEKELKDIEILNKKLTEFHNLEVK